MRSTSIAFAAALLFAAGSAQAQEMRIGFINTMTGGGAIIGKPLENGFRLGLKAAGWQKDGDKFAGVATRVFFSDDQIKPDVGLKEAEKLIKQEQVHIVAGIIWGNVFNAVARPVLEAKKLLIGGVSGQAQYAGENCSLLFASASHQNDQIAEATGEVLTRRGVKRVALLAPNYQAGKEFLDAFERTYKGGTIAERLMYKLGESDFQAEISKLRAVKPDAVILFAPGAMGVAFFRQWQASGLRDQMKVYSFYSVDESNLPAIGDTALGVFDTNNWTPELDNPINRQFVKEHVAAYNSMPAIYTVYGYDVAAAIAAGLKHSGGKFDDAAAMAAAIRKNGLDSPRGTLKYSPNGFLVQPYYLREVARGTDGKLAIIARETISSKPDSFVDKCPTNRRI
jgi:branched-chain amino acid transport system substrate-binding protein